MTRQEMIERMRTKSRAAQIAIEVRVSLTGARRYPGLAPELMTPLVPQIMAEVVEAWDRETPPLIAAGDFASEEEFAVMLVEEMKCNRVTANLVRILEMSDPAKVQVVIRNATKAANN